MSRLNYGVREKIGQKKTEKKNGEGGGDGGEKGIMMKKVSNMEVEVMEGRTE